MGGESAHELAVLAVLCWGTLTVLVAVFLGMSLRPDAGFGAAGRGRPSRKVPPRSGIPPVAIPPRHVSARP